MYREIVKQDKTTRGENETMFGLDFFNDIDKPNEFYMPAISDELFHQEFLNWLGTDNYVYLVNERKYRLNNIALEALNGLKIETAKFPCYNLTKSEFLEKISNKKIIISSNDKTWYPGVTRHHIFRNYPRYGIPQIAFHDKDNLFFTFNRGILASAIDDRFEMAVDGRLSIFFSDSMNKIRIEEKKHKVHAGIVLVGKTEIVENKEAIGADGNFVVLKPRKDKKIQSMEQVAKATLKSMRKRKYIITLTPLGKVNLFLQARIPLLVEKLILKNIHKFEEGNQ